MIPLILGFAASGLGALGFAQGKAGLDKIKQASRRAELAKERYQASIDCLNNQWKDTDRLSKLYRTHLRSFAKYATLIVAVYPSNHGLFKQSD